MIHFTSDTHFGHANIIRFSNRPYSSVQDMDDSLIYNWNKQVKPNDAVYHLGDFAFSQFPRIEQILGQLNGTKHFIQGNHDKAILQNAGRLKTSGLFASISPYHELKIDNTLICLFHYGQRVWNKSHHGSIMLYGHSHGSLPPWGKSVDVGVDCHEISPEYRPYSLDEVLEYMKRRDFQKFDHHG